MGQDVKNLNLIISVVQITMLIANLVKLENLKRSIVNRNPQLQDVKHLNLNLRAPSQNVVEYGELIVSHANKRRKSKITVEIKNTKLLDVTNGNLNLRMIRRRTRRRIKRIRIKRKIRNFFDKV